MRAFLRTCVFAVSTLLLLGCATLESIPLGAGDWVVARWQSDNVYWYPAVVASRTGDDLSLQYDDGDTGIQPARNVRRFDWRNGAHLECRFSDGNWYGAVITEMASDRYHMNIRYDDGDREATDTSKCRER